jgi:hypothetical protein
MEALPRLALLRCAVMARACTERKQCGHEDHKLTVFHDDTADEVVHNRMRTYVTAPGLEFTSWPERSKETRRGEADPLDKPKRREQ